MSNPSLKEQLQALSLEAKPNSSRVENTKQSGGKNKAVQSKPLWLEQAQYGVELLKAFFPECFKSIKEIKPLKVGIKQDLVKRLSTLTEVVVTDKACMVNSLSYYVNSPAYHKSVVVGAPRIDLDGNVVGNVTAEEANYSIERRKAKQAKKSGASTTETSSVG